MCSSLFCDCHEKIMLLFTSTLVLPHWQNQFWNRRPIMYLVSPTGEEKEKQSMKRKKKKNKKCQGDVPRWSCWSQRPQSRPFRGSDNDYLTCETILQGALPLLLSHLINEEYLSTTNLLLPNFPVGVKQIFNRTLCWIMYVCMFVYGGESCGGAGREYY